MTNEAASIPAGVCRISLELLLSERCFAKLSRSWRLNTIFERSTENLGAFVVITFISILSRRLKRLVGEETQCLTSTNSH